MSKKLFKFMTDATNLRAAADSAGSGRGEYKDFVPFDVDEMYKMVGVLFANGLAPKPRLEYWFEPTSKLPLFGSNLISKVTEKRIRLMRLPGGCEVGAGEGSAVEGLDFD